MSLPWAVLVMPYSPPKGGLPGGSPEVWPNPSWRGVGGCDVAGRAVVAARGRCREGLNSVTAMAKMENETPIARGEKAAEVSQDPVNNESRRQSKTHPLIGIPGRT